MKSRCIKQYYKLAEVCIFKRKKRKEKYEMKEITNNHSSDHDYRYLQKRHFIKSLLLIVYNFIGVIHFFNTSHWYCRRMADFTSMNSLLYFIVIKKKKNENITSCTHIHRHIYVHQRFMRGGGEKDNIFVQAMNLSK